VLGRGYEVRAVARRDGGHILFRDVVRKSVGVRMRSEYGVRFLGQQLVGVIEFVRFRFVGIIWIVRFRFVGIVGLVWF
jgi:hypothetical protein